jgi:diguanylate cyclase (GGDEF)-like protein/hemerythrin-like metal-binding protein
MTDIDNHKDHKPAFQWDNSFLTGIESVDLQHHKLVDVINEFGNLITENETVPFDKIELIFKELTDYSIYHFREEEGLMVSMKMDERHLSYHFREHSNFLKEVGLMKDRITSNNNPQDFLNILKFLTHWLAYHILGSDQSMSKQMKMIQEGHSPKEAYHIEMDYRNGAIGPLLRALNGLFVQVSDRNKELLELNKTLENRVKERTQELEKANQKLRDLAMTDLLTSLPNRRHAFTKLQDLWEESVQANTPLSCMMIDADYFKYINDNFGHDSGDKVLKYLSIQLKNSTRNDDLVCRLGGDEFFIICPNTNLKGAKILAEKIRREVSELTILIGEVDYWYGSVSVGVATRTDSIQSKEELMKIADEGVYQAKRNGKNCVGCVQNISGMI